MTYDTYDSDLYRNSIGLTELSSLEAIGEVRAHKCEHNE